MKNHSIATFSDYAAQLRELINNHAATGFDGHPIVGETEFNRLALALFALQFANNAPYRQLCVARNSTPQNVTHWSAIPAVPAAAFKEWELTSLPTSQRTHAFHSSGTTGQRPSRHFHHADSLAIYEASLLPWFAANVLGGDKAKHDFLFLTPPPNEAPHSSLVHMFEAVREKFASTSSSFVGCVQADGAWNLNYPAALASFRKSIASRRPLTVMGTAFNFVHLLDELPATYTRLQLPAGSRVMETGGYKGRSRTLPKLELHHLITETLGIPAGNIICEYGMSELSSQAYDSPTVENSTTERCFHFPPWARAQIISPETGREVADGETGLLRIIDLANVYSVMAIRTEDLAIRRGSGFELFGRATMSEPRGCSLQST